jgi:hypothetical protein
LRLESRLTPEDEPSLDALRSLVGLSRPDLLHAKSSVLRAEKKANSAFTAALYFQTFAAVA